MMPSLTCKRIFLIVLDSFGIGELPDAADYGDAGSNTLASISHSPAFRADTLLSAGSTFQHRGCGLPGGCECAACRLRPLR